MPLAIFEDGEDEELGAPLLHFGGKLRLGHMWYDNISDQVVGMSRKGTGRLLLVADC
jgi:hypothetical protein